jgi:hypothetical protein
MSARFFWRGPAYSQIFSGGSHSGLLESSQDGFRNVVIDFGLSS